MGAEALHELTAAYALDALDATERQAYEQHLAGCSQCQEELAELSGTAGTLAYAVEPVDPPAALRERILDAARAERPNVVPLRPRWASPVAAVAAIAACAVVGLGIWNISLHNRLNGSPEALQRVPVSGASGSVVLASDGAGALVLSDLASAPVGKTYEAWVIKDDVATRAGLFRGGQTSTYVQLSRPVPPGAVVAVTIEPAGGSARPTRKPFIVSTAV